MFKVLFYSIFILAFIGCGSTSHKEDVDFKTLYFIDAPINGIDYDCSPYKGITKLKNGKNGFLQCTDTKIKFSIGSLVLGTLEEYTNQNVYPQDLLHVPRNNFENIQVLKTAMFLQSIADDKNIDKVINISDEIKNKISINSLKDLSMEEVKAKILKLDKTPRTIEEIKKHLILHSSIPYIDDLTVTVLDNKPIGTILDKSLNIKNNENISKVKILKGEGREYFDISDGKIKILKTLDYKKKNIYTFDIQTENKDKSNVATLTIYVHSHQAEDMKEIPKPIISNPIIYTKTENYTVNIHGRAGTNIYINGLDINKTIPSSNILKLPQKILKENSDENISVTLGYENSKRSKPTPYRVVHDSKAPIIHTSSEISINENTKIIINLDISDKNKDAGLIYEIQGVDKRYFEINNNGELSFKIPSDFEEPLGYDNNNYYIDIYVTDQAGNTTVIDFFKITVLDILDSKPNIEPFSEEITLSEQRGNTIGRVSFNQGDSPTSLTLTGDGTDYFSINQNGEIILIDTVVTPHTFNMTITASNRFGDINQSIQIDVKETGKIAKAYMSHPLINASVKIFALDSSNHKTELTSLRQTTNTLGNFNLHTEELDDHTFYIIEITNGKEKYINEGDKKDNIFYVPNRGTIQTIIKGISAKNSTYKIRISPLSHMLYNYVLKYIDTNYEELENQLNLNTKILINEDLNKDMKITVEDLLIYNPLENSKSLYPTLKYNNSYKTLVNKLHSADISFKNDLFNTHTINSFIGNDIIMNSPIVYATDMLGSQELRLYNIESRKIISRVALPKIDINLDDYNIYINSIFNKVWLTSMTNPSYEVNLTSMKANIIDISPYNISGNYSKNAIVTYNDIFILSQNRISYKSDSSIISVNILPDNSDKNTAELYHFDSRLSSINNLWVNNSKYLYVFEDGLMHVFIINNNKKTFSFETNRSHSNFKGRIIGIEDEIIYILFKNKLSLFSIKKPTQPEFIEEITVPFHYKFGVKTDGKYIISGSDIIDIQTLRTTKGAKKYSGTVPATPTINTITPKTALLHKSTKFTITGDNLPASLVMYIPQCENMKSLGGDSHSIKFICTPSYYSGDKKSLIKNKSGGKVLKKFSIEVRP